MSTSVVNENSFDGGDDHHDGDGDSYGDLCDHDGYDDDSHGDVGDDDRDDGDDVHHDGVYGLHGGCYDVGNSHEAIVILWHFHHQHPLTYLHLCDYFHSCCLSYPFPHFHMHCQNSLSHYPVAVAQ